MNRKNVGNSAQKNFDRRLTRLAKTIAQVVARVEKLESRIEALETKHYDPCKGGKISEPNRQSTPKRGRTPKWNASEADVLRIELLNLLRGYWAALKPLFRNSVKREHRQSQMESLFREQVFGSPPKMGHLVRAARHLLENYDVLCAFLASDRYRGKSETVANAMAGVPRVSWRTSLKHFNSKAFRRNVVQSADYYPISPAPSTSRNEG
jgi:hypothetical protein